MIRPVIFALAACAATLGGAQLSNSALNHTSSGVGQAAEPTSTLEVIETELLAANRLRDGEISGYFLAKFVIALNVAPSNSSPSPIDTIFVDSFLALVSTSPIFGSSMDNGIDVASISSDMRELVNKRVGTDRVHSVLVVQADYLGPNEVRTNSAARRATIRGEVTGNANQSVTTKPARH